MGLWPSVCPGRPRRVVVGWRPHLQGPKAPTSPKALGRLKPLEAFCSPDMALSAHAMLATEEERWARDMAIRAGHAS